MISRNLRGKMSCLESFTCPLAYTVKHLTAFHYRVSAVELLCVPSPPTYVVNSFFNKLRPEQNGQNSADSIYIFVSENLYVWFCIQLPWGLSQDSQTAVMRSFDGFFDLRLNKRLNKQSYAGDLTRSRANYDVNKKGHWRSMSDRIIQPKITFDFVRLYELISWVDLSHCCFARMVKATPSPQFTH